MLSYSLCQFLPEANIAFASTTNNRIGVKEKAETRESYLRVSTQLFDITPPSVSFCFTVFCRFSSRRVREWVSKTESHGGTNLNICHCYASTINNTHLLSSLSQTALHLTSLAKYTTLTRVSTCVSEKRTDSIWNYYNFRGYASIIWVENGRFTLHLRYIEACTSS